MPLKVLPKDKPDISDLIAKCDKLLKSVETLYETHRDKNVYDAIITLEQTKDSLNLL
jgi:hypothetical protein